MRTTVEIQDSQRAELMRMAAERGEKGFSRIVQEAIEDYLEAHRSRREKVGAALACFGSFTDDQAESLRASTKRARESWR